MVAKKKEINKAIQEVFGTRLNGLGTSTLAANIEGIVTEVVIEKVDDIGVLIGQMVKMGLQEILDKHIPSHWKQRGLSWGWTIVVWLAYVISEGDHRKLYMEFYVAEMQNTLSEITGQEIDPKDFADDRLGIALKHISKKKYWNKIEKELNERTIKVYDLEAEIVRLDATSATGNHQIVPEGLIQLGRSKEGTFKPQFKIMMAGLDPLGMPLATEVVSGEKADDGLYIPIIKLVDKSLDKKGIMYVGDCKMSAIETRAYIVNQENHYLSPLPLTGTTAIDMENWTDVGVEKDLNYNLEMVRRLDDSGFEALIAAGYEFEREQSAIVDEEVSWTERVLVVKSPAHASSQIKGLENRIDTAIEKIEALTPQRGRGKRQITTEEQLNVEIEKVLKKHRINPELLDIDYEKQVEKVTKYVGPGRSSKNRVKSVTKKVRFFIKSVKKDGEAIDEAKERFGWKAFVTSLPKKKLSLSQAIINYRHEYRIERIFNRLKSHLKIAPVFMKRKDQMVGLTHLLTLGVRVLTVIEYVVRRSLQQDKVQLPDLHLENRQKETDKPTAKRLLSAFSNIYLVIIKTSLFGEIFRFLTPLSKLQMDIVDRLGLDISLYLKLEIIKS